MPLSPSFHAGAPVVVFLGVFAPEYSFMTLILFEIVRGDWALFWPRRAIFKHRCPLGADLHWRRNRGHKESSDGIGGIRNLPTESQESERFFFLPIPLLISSIAKKCELVVRNRKRKQKN